MDMTFHNSVLLPNSITFNETGENKSRLVVEPAYPGYGVTIGNALRRVLLSSLPGSAIVSAKIDGVDHEFSTIEGVKEDVVDIIINLKKIKFKSHTADPVVLRISASGSKTVTGADIEENSDVEVATKDAYIATLTDDKASLNIEITVATGLGFVPIDAREEEKSGIGEISMDAWFSPVVRVGFEVEHVRVGKMVNFDRLVMDIETDGSITPEEAVQNASRILVDHFTLFTGQESDTAVPSEDEIE